MTAPSGGRVKVETIYVNESFRLTPSDVVSGGAGGAAKICVSKSKKIALAMTARRAEVFM